MITFTLEFWQIGAAAYCCVAIFLMIVGKGANSDWWRLPLAAVWPVLIPITFAVTIGESARVIVRRLRDQKIYREFCEWRDDQKKAGKL
jgi:uncharacterized membrane protein YhaH (DUF805 family)